MRPTSSGAKVNMRKIALQEEKRTETLRDWILTVYWRLQLTQQAGCSTDRRKDGKESDSYQHQAEEEDTHNGRPSLTRAENLSSDWFYK